MTIQEIAYSAQQHLQASSGSSFKRSHIYELLSAAFGFNSHAAFSKEAVFRTRGPNATPPALKSSLLHKRCIELGYPPAIASQSTPALEAFVALCRLEVASIQKMIERLRGESYYSEGDEEDFDFIDEINFDPLLMDGLTQAANKGHSGAHYLLALIHESDSEGDSDSGSSYWYTQSQRGRILTGVEKEWAEAYERQQLEEATYKLHLQEAARLGHQDALLDLADKFDDPAFFEQSLQGTQSDPMSIAEIAERMGRTADARRWFTIAAEGGDINAMLLLIDRYDQGDLQRCWTWVYLSKLLNEDITKSQYYAFHEDGSLYDDDVGGALVVDGREGIELEPLDSEKDGLAQLAAQRLFSQITGR